VGIESATYVPSHTPQLSTGFARPNTFGNPPCLSWEGNGLTYTVQTVESPAQQKSDASVTSPRWWKSRGCSLIVAGLRGVRESVSPHPLRAYRLPRVSVISR
jgi:hypothetical protein